ncbi:MAG: YbhB/YbcL family Raf kinase inhibitor-like protein [Anaerolineaceae bacterium]
MKITCPAFANGASIQPLYTCTGKNLSPALEWSGLPLNTQSLALILEDPDAPGGTFYHWLLYELPPSIGKLPGAQPKTGSLDDYGKQGINSFGRIGYDGPCPPPGKAHRYFLYLYALDSMPSLMTGLKVADIKTAMHGHILDQAETFGIFKKS